VGWHDELLELDDGGGLEELELLELDELEVGQGIHGALDELDDELELDEVDDGVELTDGVEVELGDGEAVTGNDGAPDASGGAVVGPGMETDVPGSVTGNPVVPEDEDEPPGRLPTSPAMAPGSRPEPSPSLPSGDCTASSAVPLSLVMASRANAPAIPSTTATPAAAMAPTGGRWRPGVDAGIAAGSAGGAMASPISGAGSTSSGAGPPSASGPSGSRPGRAGTSTRPLLAQR
jgi:hypothetical protein